MSSDPSDVGLAEFFDAFMYPPILVHVGHRTEWAEGPIRIVSHVELWPWRVVVRGARADRHAVPRPSERFDSRAAHPSIGAGPGTVTGRIVSGRADDRYRGLRGGINQWSLSDDIGTQYRMTGGGGIAAAGWYDFAIEFAPAAPPSCGRLSIRTADSDVIDVPVNPKT